MRLAAQFLFLSLLLATVAGAGGLEPSLPTDDSIAVAKRQLDAMKADANASKASAGSVHLPQIALPELHATTAPATIAGTKPLSQRTQKAERTSNNWLVDAMMQPKSNNRAPVTGRELKSDRMPEGAVDFEWGDSSEETSPSGWAGTTFSSSEVREENRPAGKPDNGIGAFNPVSRYMADWMTRQNYALLRKSNELSDSDRVVPVGDAWRAAESDWASPDVTALVVPGIAPMGTPSAPSGLPKPADNPYLPSVVPADVSGLVIAPSQPSAEQPPVTIVPPPPAPETPSAKPALPDYVKPVSDEKYFKPLRRF